MKQLSISKVNNIKIGRDILVSDTLNGYMLLSIIHDGLCLYTDIRDSAKLIDTDYYGKMLIMGVDMI